MIILIEGMAPKGKGRPRFGNGHTYTDSATVEAEQRIAIEAKRAGARPYEIPCTVHIRAAFALPNGISSSERSERVGTPCMKRPDGDNVLKLCLDALNGIAYRDDSQVYWMEIKKIWDKTNWLRIEIIYDNEPVQKKWKKPIH